MPRKTFVLDTNVLLHDPSALFSFQEHDIVLPLQVIEELDNKKGAQGMLGFAAREVIRHLSSLQTKAPNLDLSKGAPLGDNLGCLTVLPLDKQEFTKLPLESRKALAEADNIILATAKMLMAKYSDKTIILISKDLNLRVKAGILGILAQDYLSDKVDILDLYTGTTDVYVKPEIIDELYHTKTVTINGKFKPNQALTLIDLSNPKHTALATAGAINPNKVTLNKDREFPCCKYRLTKEQKQALELIMNPAITVLTISGKPGTSKTFVSLLGGLKMLEEGLIRQIVITRKFVEHGRKEGFLPGDLNEKSDPWMQPFYSNLEDLLPDNSEGLKGAQKLSKNGVAPMKNYEYYFLTGQIVIQHLSYIRGVTFNNTLLIVSEAENLTPAEAKTIICRLGHNSKAILEGDIEQIDDLYLDAASNGLTYTIDKWKDQPLGAHITLTEGLRSPTAQIAGEIM